MSNTLKYRKMIKVDMKTMLFNLLIYLAILVVLNLLGVSIITVQLDGIESSYSSFDILFSSAIFVATISASTFKESLNLFIQNSFTRLEIFTANVLNILINSTILSLVCTALLALSQRVPFFSYGITILHLNGVVNTIEIFGFLITFLLLVTSVAYFITVLFNRFNKSVILLSGLAIFVLIATLFVTLFQVLPAESMMAILEKLLLIVGITENGYNTLYPVVSFTVFTINNLALSWLVIRRLEI